MMLVKPLESPGLYSIEPQVFGDGRGFFFESWNKKKWAEALPPVDFVQDNFSYSKRGTLRGLHFQNPNPQGKLVSVLEGEVFDVVVDIRRGSPTFRKWFGFVLSADRKNQLYIPPGFAHGFLVTSEFALFHYKCTSIYDAKSERGFFWNDPAIGIKWPTTNPILSVRDGAAPRLDELDSDVLFDFET